MVHNLTRAHEGKNAMNTLVSAAAGHNLADNGRMIEIARATRNISISFL